MYVCSIPAITCTKSGLSFSMQAPNADTQWCFTVLAFNVRMRAGHALAGPVLQTQPWDTVSVEYRYVEQLCLIQLLEYSPGSRPIG